MTIRKTLAAMTVALAMSFAAASAHAQDYPGNNIQFFVPFGPGGGTDLASRILTERISAQQGWNFVIENRPGAAGNIGIAQVARAAPNGLVLGMGQTSNLAINPTLYDDIPYDALKDFTPIALISSQPMVIAVGANSRYQTFEDLVADARANPAGVSMATPGAGTVSHLAMELFGGLAEVQFLHIPYTSASQAVTDAVAGHVDFAATSLPSALSQIRSGALRALAVTSATRNFALTDVPSIAELGYEGFDAGDWKAVVGPAGMDENLVARINAAINEALQDDRLREAFATDGSSVEGGSPGDFATLMDAEYHRWADIVTRSGATAD